MTRRFLKLKKHAHVDSQVLSAMMIAYLVLFIAGIITINNASTKNKEQNERMGMKPTLANTTSLHLSN
jgi:hypothetical protein